MTVSFADGFDINDHVTAGSPPVVMTGMPQIWPAFQWTWDELNEKMLAGGVPEVRHSTETALFPYYTANTTIPAPRPPTVPSMPADDFFENLEASEDWAPADGPREHLYFSQSMAHPGLKALYEDTFTPIEFIPEYARDRTVKVEQFLWMGSKGVATNMHYDDSHNCFVLLKGAKRFWMVPPAAFHSLYVYPTSHHRSRQSAVPWHPQADRAELLKKYPLFERVKKVWVADLQAGDTLILPAGWFHYVETVTASVAVNTWTRSEVAVAWDRGILDATRKLFQGQDKASLEEAKGVVATMTWQLIDNVAENLAVCRAAKRSPCHEVILDRLWSTRIAPALGESDVEPAAQPMQCGAPAAPSAKRTKAMVALVKELLALPPKALPRVLDTWVQLVAEVNLRMRLKKHGHTPVEFLRDCVVRGAR